MKVLFDYQTFSMQKYGGISRYFANLHFGLNSIEGTESELGLLFSDNAYIKNDELPLGVFNNFIKKESRRYKYNKWYCKYLLKQNDLDVFHPTYYHPYFLKSLKKSFVLTVHDMIYELFPEYFATEPYKFYKENLIKRADHIIAISECTKNDIQKFYNIGDNKISVVHHGYQMQTNNIGPNFYPVDGAYILFVGDRFGYKNFNFFIKAAAPIILKYSIKLICAGGGIFNSEEGRLINKLGMTNNIQQLAVNDDQLMHLYRHADAFVYPSLYEGFGLPVLEAFFNNCPVIVSNTSALPEVAGNAAEYFNPADEQSIAFAIEQVLSSKDKQDVMREKGRARLKLFSFDSCLQKTLKVYQSLT